MPTNISEPPNEMKELARQLDLWPVSRVDVGGELLWGKRENRDGASATARQIQFGVKYRF